jgi:hypothetical protein
MRGETTHYDTVCNDSSRALSLLGLQGACIGNGILTVETIAQAEVRADPAGHEQGRRRGRGGSAPDRAGAQMGRCHQGHRVPRMTARPRNAR